MKWLSTVFVLLFLTLVPAGFVQAQPETLSPEAANTELARLAQEARSAVADTDFETFRDSVLYLPETGKFYVNGDEPIRNEKLLREFWEQNIRDSQMEVPTDSEDSEVPEFIIARNGGLDQIWSPQDRQNLTYCVSTAFGGNHALMAAAMTNAAAAWEAAANLNFVYLPTEDAACNAHNSRVIFDVVPSETPAAEYAVAFFPNDPRVARSIVVFPLSFALDPNGLMTLDGILRHELGHVIGARHEHVRPDAGACFNDEEWRAVTNYDSFSVMHYPQCNGAGDYSFRLTESDKNGAACIYGAAAGFTINTSFCTPEGGPEVAPVVQEFGPYDIAQGDMQYVASAPVAPGSRFSAVMTGEGDPDLYVKFDAQANPSNYDCRPFLEGAVESCGHIVPEGRSLATVSVHGYDAGRFSLTITSTPPAQ